MMALESFTTTDEAAVTGRLSHKVLRWVRVMNEKADAAKDPALAREKWEELADIADVEKFERIGNFLERQDWGQFRAQIERWANTTAFYSVFRRISEIGNVVFLELEEHNTREDGIEKVIRSTSIYEFDEREKLVHLDIYLQYMPPSGMKW